MKRSAARLLCTALLTGLLTGCGSSAPQDTPSAEDELLAETTIYVDIAASLTSSFDELIPLYNERQPYVSVSVNSGSSGKLMREIEATAGHGVDLFFSADTKQIRQLDEQDGLVLPNTTAELLRNQLCLVTGKGRDTAVSGWDTLSAADSMALCDGSVPVGKYTREALVSLGCLPDTADNSAYTAWEISDALGGTEINECANVSAAAQSVAEYSNEVGTVYYSDYLTYQNGLTLLAQDDGTLTGDILYPVCRIDNPEADEAERAAAADFLAFLQSDEAAAVFEAHGFFTGT